MIINRKKIWELSWPIILANFSIPLVGLVDTLIMGHMPSSDYIAAVALAGIIFNFMYAGLNFLEGCLIAKCVGLFIQTDLNNNSV